MESPEPRIAALALALALVAPTPSSVDREGVAAESADWQPAPDGARRRKLPGVQVGLWSATRPPGGRFDRIGVNGYRGEAPARAALLYLPGTHMNGAIALEDEDHNLWLYLARRGVDVYALDYRTHAVPAHGVDDFAFMRDWTLDAFVADARAAAELARRRSGADRVFVAGFSRGVTLAYALAATEPERTAGLIVLDGGFKSHAPRDAFDRAEALARLDASGRYAIDVAAGIGWDARARLMAAAAADPSGPALDGAEFDTVGAQLAHVLYHAWRPGGLANPLDGVSRPRVLAKLLAGYDRYYPTIQSLDARSIADRPDDPRTPLDDAWGELEVPVLYFGAAGMGGRWLLDGIYSASESGSGDVTLHVLESHGHLDVLVGETSRAGVFEPILSWIRERSPAPSPGP